MIRKKPRVITHIFLIFMVSIILFPIVWVVGTSLRRDEAAFSSKLFSSRLTLQHYRDLLKPEKNIPVLVQDLQNLLSFSGRYENTSIEEINGKIVEDIEMFKHYMKESEERFETVLNSYDKIARFLNENWETIKEDVLKHLSDVKESFERDAESLGVSVEDDLYKVVLYERIVGQRFSSKVVKYHLEELSEILGKRISDEKDFYEVLAELKRVYESFYGALKKDLKNLSEVLVKLEKDMKEEESIYQSLEMKILSTIENIKVAYVPEMRSLKTTLENLLKILEEIPKSSFNFEVVVDDSSLMNSLKEISPRIERLKSHLGLFEGMSLEDTLKELLETTENVLQRVEKLSTADKKKPLFSDFIVVYDDISKDLTRLFRDLDEMVIDLSQKLEKLKVLENRRKNLIRKKEEVLKKITMLEKRLRPFENKLSVYRKMLILNEYISLLKSKITSVDKISGFSLKDILKYDLLLKSLRSMSSNSSDSGLSKRSLTILNKVLNKMKWISDYKSFCKSFDRLKKRLPPVFKKTKCLLNDFERYYPFLLKLSSEGVFVSSTSLNELYNVIRAEYVGPISGDLGIVSRKSGDLIDEIPFKPLKREFKRIDSNLFRINQIWQQKTKHYFLRWVLNSVVVSGLVAIITTFVCALGAYPFSRMRFWGRRYGIMVLLLIQMFPAIMYMVALYGLLSFLGKYIPWLGLDTLGGLIFVYLGNIAFNMYLIKGFYDTIPDSLEEAAMMDGATRFQTFWQIVIPLAKPILAVVVILTFMGTFNEFVLAKIILQDAKNYTYAVGLWTFSVGPYETQWGIFTAAALIGMTPMVILFLSLQRFLISGLTKGSVKG